MVRLTVDTRRLLSIAHPTWPTSSGSFSSACSRCPRAWRLCFDPVSVLIPYLSWSRA